MAFSPEDVRAIGTSLTKKKSGSEIADWVLASLTSIGELGLEIGELDVTTLDSPNKAKEYNPGDLDSGELAISGIFKKEGDSQTAVKMMSLIEASAVESWLITYPSGDTFAFDAFIKSFKVTEATPDGLVGFNATLRVSGKPVYTIATS